MCGFKPGDEVAYLGPIRDPDDPYRGLRIRSGLLTVGAIYTVRDVVENPGFPGDFGVVLAQVKSPHCAGAFTYRGFRKVERRTDTRDLTEWLTQPSGYDEEQHSPAPKAPAKRERVQ